RAQVELAGEGQHRRPVGARLHPEAGQGRRGLIAPGWLAGWSGPARPLHPLASTRHPLVVRNSHGAGRCRSSNDAWGTWVQELLPRACSSLIRRGNPPLPLAGRASKLLVGSRGWRRVGPETRSSELLQVV